MKIAILVPKFSEYTGDARVAELQANDYISSGHDVTILAFESNIKSNIKIDILGLPKNLFLQRIYRLFYPIFIFFNYNNVKKMKNYDLIIAHLYPMTLYGLMSKLLYNNEYYFWYHGIPRPKLYPKLSERLYIILQIGLTRLTLLNVDHAFSVSYSAKKELKKYTNVDSEVIYNKPDLSRFKPNMDGSLIRTKLNIPLNAPVFLNVGVFSPVKGAHLLTKAFDMIQKEIPNAKLVIVGKHTYSYYSKLVKNNSNMNSIVFAGYVPDEDLPYYYAMADIYLTCSLWEAHNVPVLEAQASGKPVIAFDFDFFREEVNNNGVLVEQYDINKFALSTIKKYNELKNNDKNKYQ